MSSKLERPRIGKGPTIQRKTGCGDLYVTINNNGSGGPPIEVLARLGKAGGCSYCQNEALSRAISLGLKYGVPLADYIKQLKGIKCPNPNMWPEDERSLSCPDAIASIFEEYIDA